MTEYDDDTLEPAVADFDAFFAEQAEPEKKGVPLRLYGRAYTLPAKLPALFTLQLHRVQHSAQPEDIRRLLASLFGPDAVDHWTEHGMDDDRLGIVLLWATANVAEPGGMSMERAAELHAERTAAKTAGKATPRPAKAKPKAKPRSSGKRS
ncbi:hypothetical protein [Streptomyces nigrescens]|uniref:hypothetical protein n=1 Tax=Streptomyces nigrescens TaxID=1920 RepID=UPI0036BA4C12